MTSPPRLIITPGEPAGIGPDLILQYCQQASSPPLCVVADRDLLEQRAQQLKLEITIHEYSKENLENEEPLKSGTNVLNLIHSPLTVTSTAGELQHQNAAYVLSCLDSAVELCLANKNYALVTGPVHKGNINDAGIKFSGHTEYLAQLSNISLPVMMLATKGLRVALATTHVPLADIPALITKPLIEDVLTILHSELVNKFKISNPRITVCGLNPHAGESGHLGNEEINVIEPIVKKLQQQGMTLTGPLPADTAFTPAQMQRTDAYLAMYHDQGLPVLKHVGFGNAVNITLGLPFVRTSVDHGTALELAGSGKADMTSLQVAIETAQQMLAAQA